MDTLEKQMAKISQKVNSSPQQERDIAVGEQYVSGGDELEFAKATPSHIRNLIRKEAAQRGKEMSLSDTYA